MKKIYLIAASIAVTVAATAQTQRMVLAEEFTQASCGPCASQNPAFNTLLSSNTTKVISIKYQTSWPGVDPMNAQTNGDVAPRVTYYNVSGVPYAPMDGSVSAVSSPNYAGAPANYSQSIINTRYAVPSPFSIAVSHSFSPTYDSVFVTATITASQAYTSTGALKAHIVMVEEQINFASAPGTNGETDFYGVCRKMYPSASGTTLPSTWANGASQTITIAAAVPSYIYNNSEIAFVCFVQDDGNKNVEQTAMSSAVPIPVDAAASSISGISSLSCSNTISPVVTIENTGSVTLTSCDIEYQLDANTPATYNWTGSLAAGGTTTVTLPTLTVTNGSHTLTVTTLMPNGNVDINANFDSQSTTFAALTSATGAAVPLTQNMSTAGFPYAGWSLNNPDAGITWARVTTNTGSLKYDCYNYAAGPSDEFTVEPVDLTSATAASLKFDVAYCQYTTEQDRLEVLVSTDCGATWTSVYDKAGSVLATKAAQTSVFTPTAAQWRAECVDLSAYAGQGKVFVMFRGTTAFGNNMYVDNIDLNSNACASSINELSVVSAIELFPNPANQSVNVNFALTENTDVVVNIYNTLGELVSTENKGNMSVGQQTIAISTEALANGMYTVELVAGENKSVSRLSVSH